jgi:primary-amine oxidase
MVSSIPHPLDQLSVQESELARGLVLAAHKDSVIDFRVIFLQEPAKVELQEYLDLEHAGKLTVDTPRPARCARIHYDVIGSDKIPHSHESVMDLNSKKEVLRETIADGSHACLTLFVFRSQLW